MSERGVITKSQLAAFAVGVLLLVGCADPALIAQQQAAQAQAAEEAQKAQDAREAAQIQAKVDLLYAQSPEGSQQQYQADWQTVKSLNPKQVELLTDASLGLPLTSEQEKVAPSITREQMRALARLHKYYEWLEQKKAQWNQEDREAAKIAAQQATQRQIIEAEQGLAAQQRAQQNDIWHSLAAMNQRQQEQGAAVRAWQQQNLTRPTRTSCMNVGETVSCYSY